MSTPRDLALYPAEFMELAGKFQSGTRRHEISCKTAHDAARTRLQLYGFRKALDAAGLRSEYSQFFAVRFYHRKRKLILLHADEHEPNN